MLPATKWKGVLHDTWSTALIKASRTNTNFDRIHTRFAVVWILSNMVWILSNWYLTWFIWIRSWFVGRCVQVEEEHCSSIIWFPFMATENAILWPFYCIIILRQAGILIYFSSFVSFRSWRFFLFGCGRTTNKVTKLHHTACVLLGLRKYSRIFHYHVIEYQDTCRKIRCILWPSM